MNMLDAIKPLLDSDLVNEETKVQIEEAWKTKMNETRQQVTAELREEFARRYEHDKSVMVKALDRMVTENLTAEIGQIAEEKQKLAEDRAKFVTQMKETSGNFDKFLVKKLAEEIKELHSDRETQKDVVEKLEKFVVAQLAEEIKDFQADRQDVAETKVKLVTEAKQKFAEIKSNFIKKSADVVKESVNKHLKGELSQLREDIESAKENTFGRKIFEAFATEFGTSYLNENQTIKKLEKLAKDTKEQLAEATKVIAEKDQLIEKKSDEVNIITESMARKETMNSLLKPLNKEKASIMTDLLESVQTDKLQSAFDRYLPAVLNGEKTKSVNKEVITENKTVETGNKKLKTNPTVEKDDSNIIKLRLLAGLKN
jgi:hypothetical protein